MVTACTGPPAENWLSWLGTSIREETLNSGDEQLSSGLLGCLEFSYKEHAMFSVQKNNFIELKSMMTGTRKVERALR